MLGQIGLSSQCKVLQIRRGKKDNLGIIFLITPSNICFDSSLELFHGDILKRSHNICFH